MLLPCVFGSIVCLLVQREHFQEDSWRALQTSGSFLVPVHGIRWIWETDTASTSVSWYWFPFFKETLISPIYVCSCSFRTEAEQGHIFWIYGLCWVEPRHPVSARPAATAAPDHDTLRSPSKRSGGRRRQLSDESLARPGKQVSSRFNLETICSG